MSRTKKDKPFKFRRDECTQWGNQREDQPRKRKEVDTEYHWQATPSWWTYMFMIRPRRIAEKQQLRNLKDPEEFDFIDVKRKRHIYYW